MAELQLQQYDDGGRTKILGLNHKLNFNGFAPLKWSFPKLKENQCKVRVISTRRGRETIELPPLLSIAREISEKWGL